MTQFRETYPNGHILVDIDVMADAFRVIVTISANETGTILARTTGLTAQIESIEDLKKSLLSDAMNWVLPQKEVPAPASKGKDTNAEAKSRRTKRVATQTAGSHTEPVPTTSDGASSPEDGIPTHPAESCVDNSTESVPQNEALKPEQELNADEPKAELTSGTMTYEEACAMPFTVNENFKTNAIVKTILGQTMGEVYSKRPSMFTLIIKKNGAPEDAIAAMKVIVAHGT